MRRADLLLGAVALAVGVLSFALVHGLRRIASADSRAAAALAAVAPDSAVLQPLARVEPATNPLASPAPAASGERTLSASPAVRADDPVGGIVWGHLLGPGEKPDDESWLSFRNASGEQRNVEPDERGAYSIAGLAPGNWWVTAGSILLRTQEDVLEIPAVPAPLRKDFALQARPRVDVRLVAPDGRPFFEALKESGTLVRALVPVATREPPGEHFYEVEGSLNNPFGVGAFWYRGQGGVSLPEGFWGAVLLEVDPPVHLSLVMHHLVLETRRVEATPAVVTFELDPAALAVRASALRLHIVSAATGAPISGAQVFLDEMQEGRGSASDEAGEVSRESLSPGRSVLRVDAEGFAEYRAAIELQPGVTTELELALEPEVRVAGTVSGPDGEPLEAELSIHLLRDDGMLDLDQNRYQTSDANGHFELFGLAPGRHVLQAYVQRSSPRYLPHADLVSANVLVDTRAGPVQELAIHLPRPSRVAVRWASGARKDLWLRFLDERGLPRQWGSFTSAAPQSYTLPPGRWRLEVTDAERRVVVEREFTLGNSPLELVLGAE